MESNIRFQEILKELKDEIPYIEKHLTRVEGSNAIKRMFIRSSIRKKLTEISERINNITRAVNVFELGDKVDFTSVEREIQDVQLQMDRLNEQHKAKENR